MTYAEASTAANAAYIAFTAASAAYREGKITADEYFAARAANDVALAAFDATELPACDHPFVVDNICEDCSADMTPEPEGAQLSFAI